MMLKKEREDWGVTLYNVQGDGYFKRCQENVEQGKNLC